MTTMTQSLALWEICREGLPLAADEAASQWGQNQPFELTPGMRVSRSLEALIEQCNWEIARTQQVALMEELA